MVLGVAGVLGVLAHQPNRPTGRPAGLGHPNMQKTASIKIDTLEVDRKSPVHRVSTFIERLVVALVLWTPGGWGAIVEVAGTTA